MKRTITRTYPVCLLAGCLFLAGCAWLNRPLNTDELSRLRAQNNHLMSVKAGLANELTKQQARLVSLQEQRDALMESLAQSSNAAKQLEEQKAVLSRQEAEIEERRTRIEILEDMFNIVREEWDVGRDSAMVIVDETFRAGREDLKNKKYDMAISMFHEILKTYPESPLIYRMLYKALYLSGQEEEADQVYQKYAELLKKEILKDS